jgi:hypothetical protein
MGREKLQIMMNIKYKKKGYFKLEYNEKINNYNK